VEEFKRLLTPLKFHDNVPEQGDYMKTMTKEEIRQSIKELNGKIFSVEFIKKDGTHRKMVCRTGVHKHTKGGELAFDPIQKNLVSVWDMQANGYRFIPVDRVLSIKLAGEAHEIVDTTDLTVTV
jgi:hypothetical protein